MESVRYYGSKVGYTTKTDFSAPRSIDRAMAMIDARLAEMRTDKTWEARATEYTQRTMHHRRSARGVPDRFLEATLVGWKPDSPNKAAARAELLSWVGMIGELGAPSIVVLGANGTGKTWVACGAVNDRLDNLYAGEGLETRLVPAMDGRYITAKGYSDRIKSTYRNGAPETEAEILDAYADVPLLVLDEIGRQFNSDAEKLYLFDLINERYNRHKQTMFVTNLDADEFRDLMGTAIMSRLKEGGGRIISFNWASLRT